MPLPSSSSSSCCCSPGCTATSVAAELQAHAFVVPELVLGDRRRYRQACRLHPAWTKPIEREQLSRKPGLDGWVGENGVTYLCVPVVDDWCSLLHDTSIWQWCVSEGRLDVSTCAAAAAAAARRGVRQQHPGDKVIQKQDRRSDVGRWHFS